MDEINNAIASAKLAARAAEGQRAECLAWLRQPIDAFKLEAPPEVASLLNWLDVAEASCRSRSLRVGMLLWESEVSAEPVNRQVAGWRNLVDWMRKVCPRFDPFLVRALLADDEFSSHRARHFGDELDVPLAFSCGYGWPQAA